MMRRRVREDCEYGSTGYVHTCMSRTYVCIENEITSQSVLGNVIYYMLFIKNCLLEHRYMYVFRFLNLATTLTYKSRWPVFYDDVPC